MKRLSFKAKTTIVLRLLRLMLRSIPKNTNHAVLLSRRKMIRRALHEIELVETSLRVHGDDRENAYPIVEGES